MVKARTQVNDRQIELLGRIAGGDTLSTANESGHRASVYALKNCGLVTVPERGGLFTAHTPTAAAPCSIKAMASATRRILRHGQRRW